MMERINTTSLENRKFKLYFDCLLNGKYRSVGALLEVHLEVGHFEIEHKLLKDDDETLLESIEELS